MTWKDEIDIKNIDDLFMRLLEFRGKVNPVACRGQASRDWLLQSSIDRILNPNTDYMKRVSEELSMLEKFRVKASEYLSSLEKQYLYSGGGKDEISALAILQHYRAPTRLLDWTCSPWIALYFAAIEHHDKEGAIWWFRQDMFEKKVHNKWDNIFKMKRYPPNNEVNLNDTAFESNGPLWITKLHYPVLFHRIESQQGFFTIAGRLGYNHEKLIEDIIPENQYGRIIIPALWKQEILDRLRNMNIYSKTLDYPGADLIGIDLTRDIENNMKITARI